MTFFVILLCQTTQKIETSDIDYIPTKDTEIHIAFPSALKEIRSGKHLQRVTLKKYSTRTVSRWLKSSLENASIDVNMYQSHCRLTASASKASLHGLNIQSILRAGG